MSAKQLIYGIHAVTAILRDAPQTISQLIIMKSRSDKRMQAILDLAKQKNIAIEYRDKREIENLIPDVKHQGVLASLNRSGASAGMASSLEELLETLEEPPFLLILDGVQDPHNLGACLRSANAAGVHAVIAPKDNAAGLTPVVHKVASGATQTTPYFQVTNLARTLKQLRDQGIWLFGAAGEAEQDVYQADLTGPVGIVLGAEGKGLRRLTREQCDHLIKIPMHGSVSSLNVSVATGICLFEALRQRQ